MEKRQSYKKSENFNFFREKPKSAQEELNNQNRVEMFENIVSYENEAIKNEFEQINNVENNRISQMEWNRDANRGNNIGQFWDYNESIAQNSNLLNNLEDSAISPTRRNLERYSQNEMGGKTVENQTVGISGPFPKTKISEKRVEIVSADEDQQVIKRERNRLAAKKSREKRQLAFFQFQKNEQIFLEQITRLRSVLFNHDNILCETLIFFENLVMDLTKTIQKASGRLEIVLLKILNSSFKKMLAFLNKIKIENFYFLVQDNFGSSEIPLKVCDQRVETLKHIIVQFLNISEGNEKR